MMSYFVPLCLFLPKLQPLDLEKFTKITVFHIYLYPMQLVAEGIMFLTRQSVNPSVLLLFVSATPKTAQ